MFPSRRTQETSFSVMDGFFGSCAAFEASCLMRSSRPPKPSEEVVERADTWRLPGLEAAENGIDRRRANRDDPLIDAQPELGHEKQAAEHVGGVVRVAAFGIGGVSRTHPGSGGGQIDRRDPEDQVAVEVLQEQHGFRCVVLLSQLFAYEGQVVVMRARNQFQNDHPILQEVGKNCLLGDYWGVLKKSRGKFVRIPFWG